VWQFRRISASALLAVHHAQNFGCFNAFSVKPPAIVTALYTEIPDS